MACKRKRKFNHLCYPWASSQHFFQLFSKGVLHSYPHLQNIKQHNYQTVAVPSRMWKWYINWAQRQNGSKYSSKTAVNSVASHNPILFVSPIKHSGYSTLGHLTDCIWIDRYGPGCIQSLKWGAWYSSYSTLLYNLAKLSPVHIYQFMAAKMITFATYGSCRVHSFRKMSHVLFHHCRI